MSNLAPLRTVVSRKLRCRSMVMTDRSFFSRYGYDVKLECGHTIHRDESKGRAERMRCKKCLEATEVPSGT